MVLHKHLHHYKQITCVDSLTVYVFNWTVWPTNDAIDVTLIIIIIIIIIMYIYIYIYIYIQSASEDSGCGLFAYRIYEEFHINLWECSMYGYCYIFFSIQVYIHVQSSDEAGSIMIFSVEINLLSDRRHHHTRRNPSETSRQIHLPRKQRLINRKGHWHAANEGMDSYR